MKNCFLLVLVVLLAACGRQAKPTAIPVLESEHRVCTLDIGWEALVARVAAIRSAKSSITLQTFIWTNDEVGRLIAYELLQAAKRGVRVRIIADQMFSSTDPEAIAALASANPNLSIKHYNPTASRIRPSALQLIARSITDFKRLNQRMHNKVMVVDEETAIVGGRNIENTYYGEALGLNFRDREAIVVGAVARDMAASFEKYWQSPIAVASTDLVDIQAAIAKPAGPPLDRLEQFNIAELFTRVDPLAGNPIWWREHIADRLVAVDRVAFLVDLPGKSSEAGSRPCDHFAQLIGGAQNSVYIQSPYLVLSRPAQQLLGGIRKRGVQVSVSTNSLAATDNWPSYGMYYRQKRQLIGVFGVHTYEFKPKPEELPALWPTYSGTTERMHAAGASGDPFFCLHAKSMAIDGKIACVGSFNLDPRSTEINTETVLIVWNEPFTHELASSIGRDIAPGNSWVVCKRRFPLGLRELEIAGSKVGAVVSGLTTIDLWPAQYAACYELSPRCEPVPAGDSLFYQRYRDVGNFPEVPLNDEKLIQTRLFKVFGGVLTPIL